MVSRGNQRDLSEGRVTGGLVGALRTESAPTAAR